MRGLMNARTDVEPLQTDASMEVTPRVQQMPWADQMVPKKKEMVQ